MRTAESLPQTTQAGVIQRTGCKNGVRLRQALGKEVPMHCSHSDPYLCSKAALLLLLYCNEHPREWKSPVVPDAQAHSCPQALTPLHTSITPHFTELSQRSSPHRPKLEAAKPIHRLHVNLLSQIWLYILQFLGSRLGWFALGFWLVGWNILALQKNWVSPGIFSIGKRGFKARTFLWMPTIHSTEAHSGGIWYKSIWETELLTANLLPLVSCPDVSAVLHVLWRHQMSELNPVHNKWEVWCQLACCFSNPGFRASSPGHWWHQLQP